MNRVQFIAAVIEGAGQSNLKVSYNKRGRASICFNERSNKSLHADHLIKLFDLGYAERGKSAAERNALVKLVAPGRPCTHVGLRKIVERIVDFQADQFATMENH